MTAWPMVALGEIADVRIGPFGSLLHKEDYVEGGVPLVNPMHIDGGRIVTDERHSVRPEKAAKLANYRMMEGDVVLGRRGEMGRCAVVGSDESGFMCGTGSLFLRPDSRSLIPSFLSKLISSPDMVRTLERESLGTTMPNLNRGIVSSITFRLPPLSEQRRIAAILDHVDALRAKRREALRNLRLLPQDIYLARFGDPIVNTRHLPVVPLGDLIDPDRPLTYGILMPGPDQEAGGVKYVRVVDMKDGEILVPGVRSTTPEIAESYRRSRLKSGDLLMSIRGHVGRFATVPDVLDGANITQDTARFSLVGANRDYVRECLSTYGFQRWMDRHTKGVAVRGINLGDLRKMPIPVPSTAEQDEFSSQVGQIDVVKRQQQTAQAELNMLFSALQSRAFRGEL